MSPLGVDGGIPCRPESVRVPGAKIDEVVFPRTVEDVASVVSAARGAESGLLVMGGRTRLGCANAASKIELGLSLKEMSGVLEFEPEEGVIRAAAGTEIATLRATVRSEGWELPLDSPGAQSTVGGTIASASAGPRSLAFGPVKDALLGLEVVDGEGVLSKCGGRVVKNVTGYDLARLYCGSHGSLGVVTSAWLRLRPAPEVEEAFRAEVAATDEVFESVRTLTNLASVRALVWNEQPGRDRSAVWVELGGNAAGVAEDRARIADVIAGGAATVSASGHGLDETPVADIDALRDARVESVTEPDGVRIRARVPGSRLSSFRREVLNRGLRVSVDLGLGVVFARGRFSEGDAHNVGSLAAIRLYAERAGGFATFEELPEEWLAYVDVFGATAGDDAIARSLKQRFDPANILNPGRFLSASLIAQPRSAKPVRQAVEGPTG